MHRCSSLYVLHMVFQTAVITGDNYFYSTRRRLTSRVYFWIPLLYGRWVCGSCKDIVPMSSRLTSYRLWLPFLDCAPRMIAVVRADAMHVARSRDHADATNYSKLREVWNAMMRRPTGRECTSMVVYRISLLLYWLPTDCNPCVTLDEWRLSLRCPRFWRWYRRRRQTNAA